MKLLILSAFFSLGTLIFGATSTFATSVPIESIKFECPSSTPEFSNKLKAMEDQVSLWTQANPETAEKTDLSTIFAAHLLSNTNTMNMIESSCWLLLSEFTEKPTGERFDSWNSCLNSLELHKVSQFQEIKSCWNKLSKKNVAKKGQPKSKL
jgi:hypothetical protein